MTYYELIRHYESELLNLLNSVKNTRKLGAKFFLEKEFFNFNYDENELICKYKAELEKKFRIMKPSSEATTKVFNRYYDNKEPFKNGKTEFKDALIWETIEEVYKERSQDISDRYHIWFVTQNSKDFGVHNNIHEDFNDYDSNIIIFNSLAELLDNEDIITNIESNQEKTAEELIDKVIENLHRGNMLSQELEYMLDDHVSNTVYENEFGIEGYGNNLIINKLEILEVDIDEVRKSKSTLYLPLNIETEFEFNIETKNPVYERYDEYMEEYIIIETLTESREIKCEVIYEISEDKVLEINDFELL